MAFDAIPYVIDGTTVDAEVIRRALGSLIGPTGGVVTPGDLTVTQNGTPNMSVNIGTGQIWVPGTSTTTQGPYYSMNKAAVNQAISAANPSNPRIDTIIVQVQDPEYAGSTKSLAPGYVIGTATAGATLSNLNGKGTVPASSYVLAYVLVPAGTSSIVTADIANVSKVTGMLAAANYLQVPAATSRRLGGPYTASSASFGTVGAGAVASVTVTHDFGSLAPTYFGSHDEPYCTLAFVPVDANNVNVSVGNWDTSNAHTGPNVTFWIIGP